MLLLEADGSYPEAGQGILIHSRHSGLGSVPGRLLRSHTKCPAAAARSGERGETGAASQQQTRGEVKPWVLTG